MVEAAGVVCAARDFIFELEKGRRVRTEFSVMVETAIDSNGFVGGDGDGVEEEEWDEVEEQEDEEEEKKEMEDEVRLEELGKVIQEVGVDRVNDNDRNGEQGVHGEEWKELVEEEEEEMEEVENGGEIEAEILVADDESGDQIEEDWDEVEDAEELEIMEKVKKVGVDGLIDDGLNGEKEEEEEEAVCFEVVEMLEEEEKEGEEDRVTMEKVKEVGAVDGLGQLSRMIVWLLRVRQHSATTDLKGKRHSGYLHQKGTFQFQRRFCALCGTRFLCCKSERSLKVIVEVDVKEYEVVQQERREGKTASYPHELRFSCPGKETFLFYTESRQCAEDWVKEIRRATTMKQDSVEASATDSVDSASLNDDADRQSENGEANISGGSIEKVKALSQNAPDDGRKESKLSKILTFGKKLGNKTKNLFQSVDLGNIQTVGTEQEFGYVSIRSEEFTGDRWFRRFCRIESGHLNCYTDQSSTDVRPEFSIDLRGAQLKPSDDETNELKIKLVKDGKEHCLKMTDTLHHGQWLVSLIAVTGYGDQLKRPKVDIYEQKNLYEEPFLVLSGATEDDSNLDEEPPPLPTDSPPTSPMPGHENSSRLLQKNPDPEGIYLQPSQWFQDVEELKRNKRRKPQNVAPVPVQEECAYINRDFVRQALNSRGPKKDNQTERGSINSSSSYPNLSSVGMDNDCESKDGSSRTNVTRGEAGPGAGSDSIGGRTSGKFRPSSALVESLENLTDDSSERSGRKNCRGVGGVAKGSSLSFDRGAIGLGLNQPLKKKDEQGWPKKSQSSNKIMWDELMRSSRSRTSGSESSDDLNNKKMVQNLVQMFEKKV